MTAVINAQEALRESEQSLRSAIDGIPGLVGVLAPNGDVEAVNRQILEYCGQSPEELRNWGTNGTVHPEDMPHVAEVFTKSIASGIPYQIEQRLRRFDGAYRWFDNRGIPVRDNSSGWKCRRPRPLSTEFGAATRREAVAPPPHPNRCSSFLSQGLCAATTSRTRNDSRAIEHRPAEL